MKNIKNFIDLVKSKKKIYLKNRKLKSKTYKIEKLENELLDLHRAKENLHLEMESYREKCLKLQKEKESLKTEVRSIKRLIMNNGSKKLIKLLEEAKND